MQSEKKNIYAIERVEFFFFFPSRSRVCCSSVGSLLFFRAADLFRGVRSRGELFFSLFPSHRFFFTGSRAGWASFFFFLGEWKVIFLRWGIQHWVLIMILVKMPSERFNEQVALVFANFHTLLSLIFEKFLARLVFATVFFVSRSLLVKILLKKFL